MKKNPLKLKFFPASVNYKDVLTLPEPATRHVPEWYKSLVKYDRSNDMKTLFPENHTGTDGATVSTKMCPPFLDALTAGYTYLLEDDLYVDLDVDGRPTLSWKSDILLIDKRPLMDLAIPDHCHPIHYGWRMNWYYKTPPGYSILVTHPMNRTDLPFQTLSGIIESDIWGLPVLTTFLLHKTFRGVIPKGTPIFQMIPFKRDDWELELIDDVEQVDDQHLLAENRRKSVVGHYKKTTWIKKNFMGLSKNNES